MRIRKTKHFTRAVVIAAGGLLAITIGLACLRFSFGEPLIRLSYNLPFILRSNLDTDKVILVYLDEESAKQLHQPIDDVWNRALHVLLLDRLTQGNARLVFYDIVFDQPAANPAADVAFEDSIRRNGKVILGATLDKIQRMGGVSRKTVAAPNQQAIVNSGHAPSNPHESAILVTLPEGNYTAVVRGYNNTTGVAQVEGYVLPP